MRPFRLHMTIVLLALSGSHLALAQDGQAQAQKQAQKQSQRRSQTISSTDGTYKTVAVRSVSECQALCAADGPKCKGSISLQADITKADIICKLNDGSGAKPAFPPKAPEPLDVNKAVQDLNAYRARNGLGRVVLNDKLIKASKVHAKDLANHDRLSHTGSDGSLHAERVKREGYQFSVVGENVGSGQLSWEKVFSAWQKSPHHNENLLQPDVTEFGVALEYRKGSEHRTFWVMEVAAPLYGN